MYSLKKYIDIIEGTALLENPWQATDPAKAAAWTALSPEDQKFLGNSDPTDTMILARAPNKGRPTQNVAPTSQQGQQLAAQTAGMDDPATAPSAGASSDGDAGEAEAKAAMAAKTQPAAPTGQSATPAPAASDTGEVPGVTVQSGATPQVAAPANRDAMPFGKAFADAKAKGEKQFTWKGKKYAVQMAAPKQAATPAPAKPLPGKAVPGASTSMMGNIDPATGMPSNPMPESRISESYVKELNAMRKIAGLKELDANAMMKSLGDMPGATNVQGSIDGIQKGIMGKFGDMSKRVGSSAPGANIPNPSSATQPQDLKDILKDMPDIDIQNLSGDDAKELLAQLKKLSAL